MDDSPVHAEAPTAVGSLRKETTRVRELLRACREGGVDVASFQGGMRTARDLVTHRQFDDALRQMLELKVEMLDLLLLREAQPPLPPAEIENPLVAAPPPENLLASADRPPAWKVKVPKGWRPP